MSGLQLLAAHQGGQHGPQGQLQLHPLHLRVPGHYRGLQVLDIILFISLLLSTCCPFSCSLFSVFDSLFCKPQVGRDGLPTVYCCSQVCLLFHQQIFCTKTNKHTGWIILFAIPKNSRVQNWPPLNSPQLWTLAFFGSGKSWT